MLSYSVGGTASSGGDFTALSGSVTIPAGSTSATITLPVIDDLLVEGTETVSLTLTGIPSGSSGVTIDGTADNDTINVLDNDAATVSIAGTTDGKEAGPVDGLFTVTQTLAAAADTVLSYSMGGSASSGVDYTALSGSVTIPAGSTTGTIIVPVIDDLLVEGTETVTLTLTGIISSSPGVTIDGTADSDTIDILDNDAATVSIAGTTNGNEAGPVNGLFTVTQTLAAAVDTVLSYSVGGTASSGSDFTALSGSVTIPAGSTSGTITVPVIDDLLVEGTETVTLTLTGIISSSPGVTIDGSADSDSIDILDNDAATVSIAGTTNGNESGPVDGLFTVTQTATAATDTVLSYSLGGSASSGSDFTPLSGSVTIAAGSTSATIIVPVIDDLLVEGTETVTLTLTGITSGSPGVTIDGTADNDTINILDNDAATVSIAGTTDGNEAGPLDGLFTVSQTLAAAADTVLSYSVGGSASSGVDYTALSGSVTIAAGSTSGTITVPVINDLLVEGTETVTITLTGITTSSPGVTIDGSVDSDTIDILDNDAATVSIAGTTNGNEAGPVDGLFTVSQTLAATVDTVLTYSVGGTASSGSDFTPLSGSVTIAAGSTTATIIVPVIDDLLVEGTETVTLTLTGITASSPGVTIDGSADNATIDILDNDGVNSAPVVDPIMVTPSPAVIPIGDSIDVSALFTDVDAGDTHTATWDWGDSSSLSCPPNTLECTIDQTTDVATGSHVYNDPGVYTVILTITDDQGASGQSVFEFVVVYDPNGGFVTGGGTFDSPAGAYAPDPTLTGQANFGFSSKYKKRSQQPDGNTQFQFQAGDLRFLSDSYEWLVVSGHKALYRGTGTINGSDNFGFLVSAIDANLTPSTDVDKFRIKIWDEDNGDAVVYDNQMGDSNDSPATTDIQGQIIIHTGKGKKLVVEDDGHVHADERSEGVSLSHSMLDSAVTQAVEYWADQGVEEHRLDALRATSVHVASLDGNVLGLASSSHDMIWIDRDAAGHGWAPQSNNEELLESGGVDLHSTLVHEFGHILGFEHDTLGDAIHVGERHLPTLKPSGIDPIHDRVFRQLGLIESPRPGKHILEDTADAIVGDHHDDHHGIVTALQHREHRLRLDDKKLAEERDALFAEIGRDGFDSDPDFYI